MKRWPMSVLAAASLINIPSGNAARSPRSFRAEAVEPGVTQAAQLRELLGKPMRMVREGASREYYFYDLGEGSTMDATVSVYRGVVEYVSYLCNETIKEVQQKNSGEPSTHRPVETASTGHVGALSQLLYPSKGRGYIYESKSFKVKACVAWSPEKKFEELGK